MHRGKEVNTHSAPGRVWPDTNGVRNGQTENQKKPSHATIAASNLSGYNTVSKNTTSALVGATGNIDGPIPTMLDIVLDPE
jgi:hypothetical protein